MLVWHLVTASASLVCMTCGPSLSVWPVHDGVAVFFGKIGFLKAKGAATQISRLKLQQTNNFASKVAVL